MLSFLINRWILFYFHIRPPIKPLTNPAVYSKATLTQDEKNKGVRSFQGQIYVVNESRSDNGLKNTVDVDEMNKMTYRYHGSKIDVKGRGRLGFSSREITDHSTGFKEKITFNQTYPFIGQELLKETFTPEGRLISKQSNVFAAKTWGEFGKSTGYVFPYVTTSIATSYDLNTLDSNDNTLGQWISTTTT